MERVFVIHGWSGSPKNLWLVWLEQELKSRGIKTSVPAMPNTDEPTIKSWVEFLAKEVKKPNEKTYFVGHSIGCQTIMRYLENLPTETMVGGAIFVAGFFHLPNLVTKKERDIAKEWLETPLDYTRVKTSVKNKIVAIFSDNDPDVTISDSKIFRNKLEAKIVVEHNKEHFSDDSGISEIPVVLEELLKMMGK